MRTIDHSHFPQPEWNQPNSVEAALDSLRNATDQLTADEAYDEFLCAIGNNHAGTFYPVLLGVLPDLEQILISGTAWAQRAAMESLIDLCGSFIPAPGHENYLGVSVQESLKVFIRSIRHHVAPLSIRNDARAKSAADLLALIDDQVT